MSGASTTSTGTTTVAPTPQITTPEDQFRMVLNEFFSSCMNPSYNQFENHFNTILNLLHTIPNAFGIARELLFHFFCNHFNSNETDALTTFFVDQISELIHDISHDSFPIFLVRNAESFSAFQLAFGLLRKYKEYKDPALHDILILVDKFLDSDFEQTHAQAFAAELDLLPSTIYVDVDTNILLVNELEQNDRLLRGTLTTGTNRYASLLSHCLVASDTRPSATNRCFEVATSFISAGRPTKLRNRMLCFLYLVLSNCPPSVSEDDPEALMITEKFEDIVTSLHDLILQEIKQPHPLRRLSTEETITQFTMDRFDAQEDDFSMRSVAEEVLLMVSAVTSTCKPDAVKPIMNSLLQLSSDKQEMEAQLFMIGALSPGNKHKPHFLEAAKLALKYAKNHQVSTSSAEYAQAESLRCTAIHTIGEMGPLAMYAGIHIPFWKDTIEELQTQQSITFVTETVLATVKLSKCATEVVLKAAVLKILPSLVNAIKIYTIKHKPPILALVCQLARSICFISSETSLKLLEPFEEIVYTLHDQLANKNTFTKYCQMIYDLLAIVGVPRSYIYGTVKHHLLPNVSLMLQMQKDEVVALCLVCLRRCLLSLQNGALEFLTKQLAETLLSLLETREYVESINCSQEAVLLLTMYSDRFKQGSVEWLPELAPKIMRELEIRLIAHSFEVSMCCCRCFYALAEYLPITAIEFHQDSIMNKAVATRSLFPVAALAMVSPKFTTTRISDILRTITPEFLAKHGVPESSAFLKSLVSLVWYNSGNGGCFYCEPDYFEEAQEGDEEPAPKRRRVSSPTTQDTRDRSSAENVTKALKLLVSIGVGLLPFELGREIGRVLDHFRRRTPQWYWAQFNSKTVQSFLDCVSMFSGATNPFSDITFEFEE